MNLGCWMGSFGVVLEQFGKNFFFRGTFVELLVLVLKELSQNLGTSWEKLLKTWEKLLGRKGYSGVILGIKKINNLLTKIIETLFCQTKNLLYICTNELLIIKKKTIMGRVWVLKQEKCLECDKIGVFCKSLCKACYVKKIRHSPEGKLKAKLYYHTVAKHKKPKKKPREPKEKKLCECGKISIAKNMCRNCYQKNRNNNKPKIYKPKIYKPKKIKLVEATDKLDLSLKIGDRNTGKYIQKARVGQTKTKKLAMSEITEYVKFNKDFGNCNYLIVESNVLHIEDFFDCQPIYIDMNKIYKN